jgi:hypothetical protein
MPKELTPARRGASSAPHSVRAVLTVNGLPAMSMAGLGEVKWRLGGMRRRSRHRAAFTSPVIPAAASRCPRFVLTEPSAQYPVRAVPARNAWVRAATSMGSPRLVPVPCAST